MFYILSKVAGAFVTSPVCYMILFLLLAIKVKKRKFRVIYITSSFVILFLCTNKAIYNAALRQWTAPYIHAWNPGKTYEYGILLGGFASYDPQLHRIEFNEAADRWIDGIVLYKQGKIEKIVIAADGSVTARKNEGNPALMLEYLQLLGVPPADVIIEREALNTHQNATLTLPLLKKNVKSDNCLLITSAAHMRRALSSFKEAGITPVPYIVDMELSVSKGWVNQIPNMNLLSDWQALIHEWIGWTVYKIMGY